jgi:hypothetical protein
MLRRIVGFHLPQGDSNPPIPFRQHPIGPSSPCAYGRLNRRGRAGTQVARRASHLSFLATWRALTFLARRWLPILT